MSITTVDLAKILKVSQGTVSRALNDNPNISQKTKERICELAKKMGYVPHGIASALASKKTKSIGLVYPYILNDILFARIYKGIEDTMFEQGYNIFLCCTNDLIQKEERYLQLLRQKRVDGIILTPVTFPSNTKLLREVIKEIPVIFLDKYLPGLSTHYVVSDNLNGGYLATKHLIELGHKRIGFLCGPKVTSVRDRLRGYCKAIKGYGLNLEKELIKPTNSRYSSSLDILMKEFLSMEKRPTAIFAFCDIAAIQAMEIIREKGLNIPEDIAIVGFDDAGIAENAIVPLTTVAQPVYEMGKAAAQLLMDVVNGKRTKKKILLPVKLVIRKSSGAGI